MIIVSRATKNAGKYYCGGDPEDEQIGYVSCRLVCGSIQGPKHGQTIALSLIRGYGTGRDHIDLLRRWSFSEKVVLH